MSELTLFKGGVPSFLKGVELDETTKSLMGGGSSIKRISIKGNVFRMMANGEEVATNEDRAMNIVIVKAAPFVARTFYEGTYKDGANDSPTCWSADGKHPDAKCQTKVSPSCMGCEMNVAGSGEGKSKACRHSRKLAVVLDGDMSGDVYQLALPALSIFGKGEEHKLPLEAYATYLGSHGVPITAVVTEMRFDLKSPVPKLTFKPVRGLTEAEWEICRAKAESDDAAEAITHTFTSKKKDDDDGEKFEQPKARIAKPKPQPLEEDDTPEPVKVASKKPAPVKESKADISALIDEWAED